MTLINFALALAIFLALKPWNWLDLGASGTDAEADRGYWDDMTVSRTEAMARGETIDAAFTRDGKLVTDI